MAAKIEKMTFVSIVHKGTYEPLAQLSLKWGKSGVGFTMIKNDDFFFKISPCKCSLSLIFFPFQIHAKILWQFSDFLIAKLPNSFGLSEV